MRSLINDTLRRSIFFVIDFLRMFRLVPGKSCKYTPSCSQYAKDALNKYGILKGLLKGAWRLLRCHPFSEGGYDPA